MTQDCSYNELHPLQVLDDSMEPEFPRNCIIVIEPSEVCATGAYVIVNLGDERWFRQYVRYADGSQKLKAVNPVYPDIPIESGQFKIEGVVVQRNVRRKIKHYHPYRPDNGIELR
ncbi:MAG: S24 family peptidase [Gammaproteobacteria bacterium]|nr:S24 family peptidase [Gammaproteobacteria bacterium]HXK56894.1 S24 family peptidase [Gammaproteobacteria bacterium]